MKNQFRPLLLALIACFGLTIASNADTIVLRDGTEVENAKSIRDLDTLFLFEHRGSTQSVPHERVQRILGRRGKIVYEALDLRVVRTIDPSGDARFSFQSAGRTLGQGGWEAEGIFAIEGAGLPDGTYLEFYDSGKIQRELPLVDGQLHGTCRVYFESGQVEREGTFVGGFEQGTSKLFYSSGALKGESDFQDGLKEGVTRLYYPGGELRSEMTFVAGQGEGRQRLFFVSGLVEAEVVFVNGEKHGEVSQYFETGRLKFEGLYVQGSLHGETTTYYESGKIKRQQTFLYGRLMSRQPAPSLRSADEAPTAYAAADTGTSS